MEQKGWWGWREEDPHLAVVQREVIVFVLSAFQESDLLSADEQW